MCLPFCARYLCIIMKGEVGGERRKEHNYCFLVAIYGIFLLSFLAADQSAVFVF